MGLPDDEYDVLVAGGGNAALCAAISARRRGARVLVLEGAPKFYRGGNTRHTRNMRCAHDSGNDHLTGPYLEDEFWDDLQRVTQGKTDEELARHMIAQSKPMLGWIAEQGVRFQPSLGGTLSLGRTNSFFLGGGRAMLNALYRTAERLGVEVLYDTPVVDLDMEGGRFRTATARHDGQVIKVRATGDDNPSLWQAFKDTLSLRYLDGGGVGCNNEDERPNDLRRLFHHLTFYGFLLCFASTISGTVLHYLFDNPAPYGWLELPKLLGIPGGIGLSIGAAGLLHQLRRDPDMMDIPRFGMDTAFIAMMGLAGFSGLLLMALRTTPAMGAMLALHLGVVFALFLTMPYGKFVHGLYRVGALVLYAIERRTGRVATARPE